MANPFFVDVFFRISRATGVESACFFKLLLSYEQVQSSGIITMEGPLGRESSLSSIREIFAAGLPHSTSDWIMCKVMFFIIFPLNFMLALQEVF